MSASIQFEAGRTALLGMDCQTAIVSIYVKDADGFLTRAAAVMKQARAAAMTVIHVQVGFRPGLPEIGTRNPIFSAVKASAQHQSIFQGERGAIHPASKPEDGDIVVTKHRVSAFTGTDLEMILRANEIDTLVLFGIATSGVVLSTLLEASDTDYRIVVIKDCCADQDAELHSCLMEKLFPRRASVITAEEFLEAISTGD